MERFPQFPSDDGGDELDVEDAFGEHDVEYWVRGGSRLVPATPEQITAIRELEALLRLARWQRLEAERAAAATLSRRWTPHAPGWAARIGWLAAVLRHPASPPARVVHAQAQAQTDSPTPAIPTDHRETDPAPADAGLIP